MNTIIKSSNYDQFDTITGNRKIYSNNVNKLIKSIQEKNMLEENPIIVSMGKIIDGQHRLEAAKKLNIPYYYVEHEGANLEDIRRLNSNSKPWSLDDYLNSYADLNDENYILLKEFLEKYKLPLTVSIMLLTGTSGEGGIGRFRRGTFKIERLKAADEEAQFLLKVKPYTEGEIWRTRTFIDAIKKVWAKVDKEVFQQKIVSRGERLRSRMSMKEYLRDLEDIYNYRLKENQIRFY